MLPDVLLLEARELAVIRPAQLKTRRHDQRDTEDTEEHREHREQIENR